jgi:hypothetical protein
MKKKNRAPRKKSELSRIRQTTRATRGAASRKLVPRTKRRNLLARIALKVSDSFS